MAHMSIHKDTTAQGRQTNRAPVVHGVIYEVKPISNSEKISFFIRTGNGHEAFVLTLQASDIAQAVTGRVMDHVLSSM